MQLKKYDIENEQWKEYEENAINIYSMSTGIPNLRYQLVTRHSEGVWMKDTAKTQ